MWGRQAPYGKVHRHEDLPHCIRHERNDPAAAMPIKHTSKPMKEALAREGLESKQVPQHEIDALIASAQGAKSK